MKHRAFQVIAITCYLLLYLTTGFSQEGGYLSSLSVAKGDKLAFYLSTSVPIFEFHIYKLGKTKTQVFLLPSVKCVLQSVPDSAFALGCNWEKTTEIIIPEQWLPGVYEADLPTSEGIKPLVFVVREKELGSYSKAVVCLTANTWQAYNNWGGKSLYHFNSSDRKSAVKVSFDRPFSDSTTDLYYRWTNKLVTWLENEKIPVEFCVNSDLDRDPKFLDHYKVYLTVGHDEYWSRPERNACEHLLGRAGKLIVLSGNTCWWQVRFEDSLRTLVCYKTASLDPDYQIQDSIVSSVWSRAPIYDPPNSFIGVSFEAGGYVNNDTILPASQGYGGYTVFNANHWIYKNTDVDDGEVIGKKDSIVGYETDGASFYWIDGTPAPIQIYNTPSNFIYLGISPAATDENLLRGHATMGYFSFPGGGEVFNAASINWVNGLTGAGHVIPQMLRNIFHRFLNKEKLPPEILRAEPVTISVKNINYEDVDVPSRTLQYRDNDSVSFFVHAVDPQGKVLHYFWKIGELVVSRDTFCTLPPDIIDLFPKGFALEAFVTNTEDTISTEWKLTTTDLAIVSIPPADLFPLHANYLYRIKAISKRTKKISYSLVKGPSWLHVDQKGVISGKIDAGVGAYGVTIEAIDNEGYSDKQEFFIIVIDTGKITNHVDARNGARTTIDNPRIECYPNPFSEKSNIIVTLEETAVLEIEIFDVTGNLMSTLLPQTEFTAGSHGFIWNRLTSDSKKVPAGVYFCRATIGTPSGKKQTIVEKLIVM